MTTPVARTTEAYFGRRFVRIESAYRIRIVLLTPEYAVNLILRSCYDLERRIQLKQVVRFGIYVIIGTAC